MLTTIQKDLFALQDLEYLKFHQRLVNSKYPIIGIRVPKIKEYYKKLTNPIFKDQYYEEVLLHGLYLVKNKNDDFITKCNNIEKYLDKIDNWAINDTVVSEFKDLKKHLNDYYPYVIKYLKIDKEYYHRYSLVVLLDYYINEQYLNDIFKIIQETNYLAYYDKMAAAWLLSYCFIKYFDETVIFIKNNNIDEFVFSKGISKAIESYRINQDQKTLLRKIKQNKK